MQLYLSKGGHLSQSQLSLLLISFSRQHRISLAALLSVPALPTSIVCLGLHTIANVINNHPTIAFFQQPVFQQPSVAQHSSFTTNNHYPTWPVAAVASASHGPTRT